MTQKEILDRAYGSIPKEVGISQTVFDWVPTGRGIKYFWIKIIRFFTR